MDYNSNDVRNILTGIRNQTNLIMSKSNWSDHSVNYLYKELNKEMISIMRFMGHVDDFLTSMHLMSLEELRTLKSFINKYFINNYKNMQKEDCLKAKNAIETAERRLSKTGKV